MYIMKVKLLCYFIKESIYTEGAKFGCDYVIKHFKNVCVGACFSVRIIEVLPGTGYNNNKASPVNRETMLDRED